MSQILYLVDKFDQAAITGAPGSLAVRDIALDRDSRIAIFQHPDSEIVFPPYNLRSTASLRFGIGMLESVWNRMQSPVEFSLALRHADGREIVLFRKSIDSRRNMNERRWLDQAIDLPAGDTPVQIVLRTRVGKYKGSAWCWAAWANPVLEEAGVEAAPTLAAARTQPLIVLVTSDALRMDYLGCYGGPVSTPNLDRLAGEGVLFEHARTQSSLSLGAYASLLSSRNPLIHKINGEWGHFPENLLSLPAQLGAWGFHTMIAASEADLDDRDAGFSRMFAERVPCIGHPAQSGEITTRRVVERLKTLPDQPTFLWIQLFDTHPPLLAKAPYSTMYYPYDPTSAPRRHMAEQVSAIRGVESLADLLASIGRMEAGEQQASIIARLRGATDQLLGRAHSGPDLAAHLKAAPRRYTRGLTLPEFARWLDQEVVRLEHGHNASPALIDWLRQLLPFLRDIETEITSWLTGVVDYRYALAQYQAAVSYMDHQVGVLCEALRQLGLDEHATLLFTSPHGEALGESGTFFHHHLLHESVLRVPLIVRPARQLTAGSTYAPGRRINGICDLIDLYPTLMQALELPCPPSLEGRSRWSEIISGQPIAPHPSFAVDRNEVALSVTTETHKYWYCCAPHSVTASCGYRTGETRVLLIAGSNESACQEQAGDLSNALHGLLAEWAARHGHADLIGRQG